MEGPVRSESCGESTCDAQAAALGGTTSGRGDMATESVASVDPSSNCLKLHSAIGPTVEAGPNTHQAGGVGLGRAISESLAARHRGTIAVYKVGDGDQTGHRVQSLLPGPSALRPSELNPSLPQSAPSVRILLVDDHRVTTEMMELVLTAEGHAVDIAGDVATALELADHNHFDLLVSDLGLPDGSGHDLMRALRSCGHCLPGIAVSGYGEEDDLRRSFAAGFAAHLIKPASPEAIVGAINMALQGPLGTASSRCIDGTSPSG